MRRTPRTIPCIALALAAACAGVSVRPEAAAIDDLPVVALDPAQTARRDRLVASCVQSVMLRRYGDAEREALAALALDPRAARARAALGLVQLQQARLQEPPDLFLQNRGERETVLAEQLAPEDPFVGRMRASFLAEVGHLSAAAAAAEAALARCAAAPPDERAALLGAAGTYRYELGESRTALPLLQSYVGIRPDEATAHFRIGSCLLRLAAVPLGPDGERDAQRQAETAAHAFARCFELAPGDEDAGLAAGAALLRAAELAAARRDATACDGHRDAAARQFERLAGLFPGSAEAPFRRGVVAELRGDAAAARAAYEQALQRDAAHLGSLLNLAALADRDGPREQVADLLRRALAAPARGDGLSPAQRRRIETRLAEPGR